MHKENKLIAVRRRKPNYEKEEVENHFSVTGDSQKHNESLGWRDNYKKVTQN